MNKDAVIIRNILKKNGLTEPARVTKFKSGQINRVYDIDGKFVIKLQGKVITAPDNLFKHQIGVTSKLLAKGAKIPEIIDCGSFNGQNYVLMKKINGRTLAKDWLNFSPSKKESFMAQLAEQFRIFHSLKFEKYAIQTYKQKLFATFEDAYMDDMGFLRENRSKIAKLFPEQIEFLENFYLEHKSVLRDAGDSVFVQGDFHFENVLYQDNLVTGIIDFDFSCQAPKEYELYIFADFSFVPVNYVEKKLEASYAKYQMKNEAKWFLKYYPEIVEVKDFLTRLRLYLISGLVWRISEYKPGKSKRDFVEKMKRQILDMYEGDWLQTLFGL